jgi:succinyl-diaminopimelate desuccinylase
MIKIGRRGSLNARLRVLGSQGHVAYPHLADNPLPRLVAMLTAITAEPLDSGTGHFQPSSLVLTSIDTGNPATNVSPGSAEARFNIRFNPLHSFASLEAWLRQRLDGVGGAYELHLDRAADAFLTPAGRLTEALSRAIVAVTGVVPTFSTSGGTSDARFIKDACPVAEFGLVNRTMHKTDERVAVADLATLTRIYFEVLLDLCGPVHPNGHPVAGTTR